MAEYTDKALKIVQNAVNAKPVGVVDDFNDAMLQRVRDTIAGKKADFINKFANNELDVDIEDDDIDTEDEDQLTPEEEAEIDFDDEEQQDDEDQPITDDQESEEKTDG